MPLLGYFTVVGGALLGLLFVADATMSRPTQLSFSSNFDGLPETYKGSRSPTPAPRLVAVTSFVSEPTGRSSAPEPAPETISTAAPMPAPEIAKPIQRRTITRRARSGDDSFDALYREASGGEPSWRESWASGGHSSGRERSRRGSPSHDFWRFR